MKATRKVYIKHLNKSIRLSHTLMANHQIGFIISSVSNSPRQYIPKLSNTITYDFDRTNGLYFSKILKYPSYVIIQELSSMPALACS